MNKFSKVSTLLKGGPGSGNFGHAGRPGEQGGSGEGAGGGSVSAAAPRSIQMFADASVSQLRAEKLSNPQQIGRAITNADLAREKLQGAISYARENGLLSDDADGFIEDRFGKAAGLIADAEQFSKMGDKEGAVAAMDQALAYMDVIHEKFLDGVVRERKEKAFTAEGNPSLTPTGYSKKPVKPYRSKQPKTKKPTKPKPRLPVESEVTRKRVIGFSKVLEVLKGGPGSGDFGHAGRPGEVGGSAGGGGGGSSRGSARGGGKKPSGGGEKKPSGGRNEKPGSLKTIKPHTDEVKRETEKGRQALSGFNPDGHPGANNVKLRNAKGRFTGAGLQAQAGIDQMKDGPAKANLDRRLERIYGRVSSAPLGREASSLKSAFRELDSLASQILQHAKTSLGQ